jgi:hypothetical protein
MMGAFTIVFVIMIGVWIGYPGFRYDVYCNDKQKIETRFFNEKDVEIEAEIAKDSIKTYYIEDIDSVIVKKNGKLKYKK